MIKSTTLLWLFMLFAPIASAGQTFHIKKASREYDLVISVGQSGADDDTGGPIDATYGPAHIRIYHKRAKSPFQTLWMPRMIIEKDALAFNPKISHTSRGLYDMEYSVVFEDFNFDGREDLAVLDGRESQYGGPSYTVYLFDSKAGKFVKSKPLTRLAHDYLGLFLTDARKKQILAFGKSGASWHEARTYTMVHNAPKLVEVEIDDADNPDGPEVITARTLARGRWKTRVLKYKKSE